MRVLPRMRRRTIGAALALALLAGGLLLAPHAGAEPQVIRVPSEVGSLQAAIDLAAPGDLILVAPGVYPGGVTVPIGKDNLTIRGLDRNTVILDGNHERQVGITSL